jgi:hypothetical protein
VEGALTVLIALIAAIVLPKTPYTTSWLSEKEKEKCLVRMRQDSTVDVGSAWSFSEGIAPFKSWQVYYWSVIGLCYGTSGSALGSFLPQIVGLMGFDTLKTNLYAVAPNLVGAVVLFCIAKSSDRFRERSGHMMLALGITFVGWVILVSLNPAKNIAVSYFACFLLCGGAMTPTVIFHSWHTSNTPTENGRIYVLSFMTGAANAGGIIASLVFRQQDAPRYIPFLATAAAFEAAGIVLIMGLRTWMVWDNRRKDRIMGRKLVSKDVSMPDIKDGTNDIQWRWFV